MPLESIAIIWPCTGKKLRSDFDQGHNFRELHQGGILAECLAVAGAWAEFDELLQDEPCLCSQIALWSCEPGDPEASALWEARRRAQDQLASANARRH